jgi:HSP20 family protein
MKLINYRPINREVWSPFDRLHSLRDLFDSAFTLAAQSPSWSGTWAPPLDVSEDENQVTVELELAGMNKEDFDISLENDVLTISGERKQSSDKEEGESFRSERFFGQFRRSVTLPSAVDPNGVSATYQDGVLRVSLPKAEEAKPRKIEVKLN